jgi:SAM-dependent methyltransferase
MMFLERIHGGYVCNRRVRVLSGHLAELIPPHARVLDVGSGDGLLAHAIAQRRTDIEMSGIDVLVRSHTHIPVRQFDGKRIPHEEASFDVVMFVDVLHHSEDSNFLLREAVRVARKALVIKDHILTGFLAGTTLQLMDWVGNRRHGVALPFNYWTEQQWRQALDTLQLKTNVWNNRLRLYPWPARWVFERSLHFVARLEVP